MQCHSFSESINHVDVAICIENVPVRDEIRKKYWFLQTIGVVKGCPKLRDKFGKLRQIGAVAG